MAQISVPRRAAVPRWRINIILLVVFLMGLLTTRQLVLIQVYQELKGRRLDELVQGELTKHVVLQPRRGTITDRNGVALAMNVNLNSLYVDSTKIEEPEKMAILLAPIISREVSDLIPVLSDKTREWTRLARWITPEAADQIRKLGEDGKAPTGLFLVEEAKRVYPQGEFASRIVGAANYEGTGIAGVEAFYNDEIKGITGTLQAEQDRDQRPIWIAPTQIVEPQDGVDVKLTIDSTVQKLAEDELRRVVEEQQAEGATILIMDPSTGEILGLATWPVFDPNRYTEYEPEKVNRNNALTDVYEPGSTFKVILTAMGLQTGSFTPDTTVYDGGVIHRYGYDVGNWNRAGNGVQTPGQMLYNSSNVAAVQFSEMVGRDNFYKYIKLFGYGQLTGIDLGGEGQGIVNWPEDNPENWSDLTLGQNSFGQGIAVTPIQHLTAFSAIANGGTLMWPHVVKEKCLGTQCTPVKPRVVRRVVDQGVTDAIRGMLTTNAEHYANLVWGPSTGNWADQPLVPGYHVSAKTGTSQIPVNGGYDNNSVIGSVIGFAPSDNPRVAVLVKIDRPKKAQWGIEAAIPVYQRIVTKLMTHYRIPPDPHYVGPGQVIGGPR